MIFLSTVMVEEENNTDNSVEHCGNLFIGRQCTASQYINQQNEWKENSDQNTEYSTIYREEVTNKNETVRLTRLVI